MSDRPTKIDDTLPESHRRVQAHRLRRGARPWEVAWPGSLPCDETACYCGGMRVQTWPEALTIIRDRVNHLAAQKETRP